MDLKPLDLSVIVEEQAVSVSRPLTELQYSIKYSIPQDAVITGVGFSQQGKKQRDEITCID